MTTSPSPDRGVTDRAADLLDVHQAVWIDREVGWECGCNEDGRLNDALHSYSDVAAHQADMLATAGFLAHPDDGLRDALRQIEARRGQRDPNRGRWSTKQFEAGLSVAAQIVRALLAEDGTRVPGARFRDGARPTEGGTR